METKINSLNINIIPSSKFETINLCLYLLQRSKNTHSLFKIIRQFIDKRAIEQHYIMSRTYANLNIVKFYTHTFENSEGVVLQFFVKVILFGEIDSRSKMVGVLKLLRHNLYVLLLKTGLAPDNKIDIYIMGKEKSNIIAEEVSRMFSQEKKFKSNNYAETSIEIKELDTCKYKILFSERENSYNVVSLVLLMISFLFLFSGPNSIVNELLRIKHRSIYNYYTDMCLVDNSIDFSFRIDPEQKEKIQELVTTIENSENMISENSLQTTKKMLKNIFDNLSDSPEATIDFNYKYKYDISTIYQFNDILSSITLEQIKSYLGCIIMFPNKIRGAAFDV